MIFRVLFVIFLSAVSSTAQSSVKISPTAAPQIDGILAENEWKSAAEVELVNQFEPQQLAKATERTEAFLMFDKEFLYVAFRAYDSDTRAIRAPVSKRDAIEQDDFVSVLLDTFDDRCRTYAFRFNS